MGVQMKRRYLLCFCAVTSLFAQTIEFDDPNLESALLSSRWNTGAQSFAVDANADGAISVQEALDVRGSLSLYNESISNLNGMQFFENLMDLNISKNNIVELAPLQGLKLIRVIQADDNPISNLSSLPKALEKIIIRFCIISGNQSVDSFPNLTNVNLSNNAIEELHVTGTPRLEFLRVSGNRLTTLDVDGGIPLRRILLSANEFTHLPDLPETVEIVSVDYNHLSGLSGLPVGVRVLDVQQNKLHSDGFVAELPGLVSLIISNNYLTSVSQIARHPLLGTSQGIDCSGIPIGCTEYHYLDVAKNFLSQDDCGDLKAILAKAPTPAFPNFGRDISELCASHQGTLWIPHLTRPDGGFETGIHLLNQNDYEVEIPVQLFDETGDVITTEFFVIPADATVFFNPDDQASHASLPVVSGLDVSVTYRGTQQGVAAFVTTTSRFGHVFWVQTGDWPQLFDGIALINMGDIPATVSVDVFTTELSPVSTGIVLGVVDPFAKLLSVLSEHLPLAPSIVVVRSSQPAVVQFLRGTPPDIYPGYLFTNEPFRVD